MDRINACEDTPIQTTTIRLEQWQGHAQAQDRQQIGVTIRKKAK